MKDYTTLNNTQANTAANFDAGLRSYMIKVFNYMLIALGVSGAVSYFAGTSIEFQNTILSNPALVWVIALAPLAFVFIFSFGFNKMSVQTAQIMFWAFSVLMGLSLWFIFAAYTQSSIVKTFFITAATFGGMSLYGYTTKKDLSGMGSFLIMGVWGIVIASLVNIFFQSPAIEFAVSIVGVLVFTGLTAYDTQKIKTLYYQTNGDNKVAIMSALNLYMDFINLFLFLLRLMGNRR